MLDPLLILAMGIVAVLGMIIVFRVNAFVALITAAVLVSLLSAGETSEKIARVAVAFGQVAGSIGIVIAMAAVIGKCLMDSGAADRIVRAFLRVLGEKRASVALMGSGFVLSIPVFFDTVFYLLVPLARSLWRRTHKNYLLYITAIGAGAAITHTLVPPTPGPLLMAENLKIDIGVMMMIGSLVGFCMATAALLFCSVMNRLIDIPMRPYGSEAEPEPIADDQLPSLWISLAPVLLPVILISANTVTAMVADSQHSRSVSQGQVLDWHAFGRTMRGASRADAPRAARPFRELLPGDVQESLAARPIEEPLPADIEGRIEKAVRELVGQVHLHRNRAFVGVGLSDDATKLRDAGFRQLSKEEQRRDELAREDLAMSKLSPQEVERFNWLLLESAFPGQRARSPAQKAAEVTALLGNANLALLLSAAIAMFVLVRQRKLTFRQLGQTTENALMSGGVIILITAGGGAFGKMLQEAGVKEAIVAFTEGGGQEVGWMMLLVGFVVAAVMKLAQGSSTVAMITTSAMMGAMGATTAMLGFHVVYLAVAIGCGSLCGSWMNDSGFWIFSRMSGLTEVEALKTWTVLLILIALTGLLFTLLFASILPLSAW